MQRPKRTNEQILYNLRYSQEWYHRRYREYFGVYDPLTLTPCLPNPPVRLEHIQDSCNKSTAVYSMTPHLEPHIMVYSKDSEIVLKLSTPSTSSAFAVMILTSILGISSPSSSLSGCRLISKQ